jgi:hypothetical protein
MNERERKLLYVVVGVVALYGGWMIFDTYTSSRGKNNSQLQAAQSKLAEVNREVQKGRMAVTKLAELQKRSLPTDRDKAQTMYKAWLLDKAKAAGLTVNDIKLAQSVAPSKEYDAFGYKIQASGTLSSVVSMLYEFYHSPQLHQITRMQLTRPAGATQMQIAMDVEALCLKGAIAKDSLPEGELKRLKLASASEYQKRFDERDLATVYTPPRPPAPKVERRETAPPPAPPKFDEAETAFFTASIESNKGAQAWVNVRTTGETLRLNVGDPIKVGAFEGTIESVDGRALVLKTGDKKYRVPLGKSIRSGDELDANGNVILNSDKERPKNQT